MEPGVRQTAGLRPTLLVPLYVAYLKRSLSYSVPGSGGQKILCHLLYHIEILKLEILIQEDSE